MPINTSHSLFLNAAALGLYLILLVVWTLKSTANAGKDFSEFSLAGRSQSTRAIALSLIATTIGGSAIFGVSELAYRSGGIAALWMAVAAVGLILQAIFIAKPVRNLACHSLPEVAGRYCGPIGQRILGSMIAIAWVGVIAVQFLGLAKILNAIFPTSNGNLVWVVVSAAAIIAYTAFGGQRAVIKTDAVQALILLGVLAFVLGWLHRGIAPELPGNLVDTAATSGWTAWDMVRTVALIGGAFFIGPDLFSRNASARDGRTARKAGLWAGPVIGVTGLIITGIGLWARHSVPASAMAEVAGSPFVYLLTGVLPEAVTVALVLCLVGALLSSADTCLIGIATIIEVDIVRGSNTVRTRLWVVLVGGLSLIAAVVGGDIIRLLFMAYAVYVPGVVGPLAIALLSKDRHIDKVWWLAGMVTGGALGLAGEIAGSAGILPDPWARPGLALLGLAISIVFALQSRRRHSSSRYGKK